MALPEIKVSRTWGGIVETRVEVTHDGKLGTVTVTHPFTTTIGTSSHHSEARVQASCHHGTDMAEATGQALIKMASLARMLNEQDEALRDTGEEPPLPRFFNDEVVQIGDDERLFRICDREWRGPESGWYMRLFPLEHAVIFQKGHDYFWEGRLRLAGLARNYDTKIRHMPEYRF